MISNGKPLPWLSRLLASAVALTLAMALSGCGADRCPGCDGGSSGGGGWDNSGGLSPWAPGGGSGTSDPTLNLGTATGGQWGQTGQTSPQLGPRAPVDPAVFDSDTRAVLARYNAQIVGDSATPERIQRVVTALQLYKGRNHQLTVDVTQDDSKLPTSAMWSTNGYTAMIEFWQPDLQHTIDHEVAHDMTLLAMENEGNQFSRRIQARWGEQNTWPSDYAQTDEREAMAESLSFLAEAYAGLATDEQAWGSFNPAADIQEAAKVFMSDTVLKGLR